MNAPCCGKAYVCRLCHDAEEDHQMDRFLVKEVQCSVCNTVQQAQKTCQECNVTFGDYYCDICHLFDKDKKQYHCQPCGICRIGPREKYFHCQKCNLCLASDLRGNHKCVENVSRQNCPVCMEDMHTSRIGAHVLPCGHLLHKTCFDDMVRTGAYRCPLCMHSAWNMEDSWEQMDKDMAQSPMPTEYQDAIVKIICNDCQTHCTVPFHVLGMKCSGCGSYNTAQDGGLIQQLQEPQPQEPQPQEPQPQEPQPQEPQPQEPQPQEPQPQEPQPQEPQPQEPEHKPQSPVPEP
ncbi:RING finger and CHY zinc finger domain-containing protein 1 isoform X2 [Salmo trutta]|uniref:RING finger and CHY zinc finger domain-containing protein 1 isoform X2 n=1 Tax=Salmo trutta TaxID=8032 RepID=UPI00112FEBA4|nr:RING finger and CHY zinc finger domain-containing protein 1-like isoform X2 [Salmo trutta]